ncbi:mycothiol system anti-sigma-R factor [Salana multivorans]|uniref:Mycothiol system anti-sigma-R factor n=1 Tax=Salana multivorans TaxID=120377 RepID=A0A3N2D7R2_9MICO|nr:mycothiol system anti-sigma-R factor [Salana multivorans]ROR95698.1 mycothiol system anti-sigma-R factor [Salana multivorans]
MTGVSAEDGLPLPGAGLSAEGGTCAETLARLAALLDHAMAEPDADALRAHIEGCDPCTEAADAEEAVRALIRRACLESAPETLRVRILSQLIVRRL